MRDFDRFRANQVAALFRQSASLIQKPESGDPCATEPVLLNSKFFSQVRGAAYTAELRVGAGKSASDLSMMLLARQPNSIGRIPSLMMQFTNTGEIVAMVELEVTRTRNPREYRAEVASAVDPQSDDERVRKLAKKVADVVVSHLTFYRSFRHPPGRRR